jgi:hypothetical protein
MATLTQVSTEHRERLMRHVDALPGLADEVGHTPWTDISPRLADQHSFLTSTLVPHMEVVESGVHRELDRLLSCRLAMEPMEREHIEVRRLIDQIGAYAQMEKLGDGQAIELNRVLLKLYSILKVHLREESMYIPILEHNLDREQVDALVASMEHAARVEL